MDNSDIVETTRVTEFEGEEWPCFVFPDHQVPPGLIEPRPNKHALPVMLLERQDFEWRSREALNDSDPCEIRTFDATRTGEERKQAFNKAVEYHGMDHYHNLAWSKQAAQDLELKNNLVDLDDSDDNDDDSHIKPRKHTTLQGESDDEVKIISVTKKKRSYSSAFKRPSLPTPSPTPNKKARTSSKLLASSLPFGEDDSDVDLPHPSTLTPTPKKTSKPAVVTWKPSGNLPRIDPTDYVAQKQLELFRTQKGDGKSSSPEKSKVLEPVKE